MQQLKDIKKHILPVLGEGEILLIIPPFGSIYDLALGPHILQALAREKGRKTDILYLNMLLASVIGHEQYEKIHDSPISRMLGERLFARSAYGLPALGKSPGFNGDEAPATRGCLTHPGISYNTDDDFDLEVYLQTEQFCKSFIDEVIPVIAGLDYKITGCTTSMMGQTNCCMALLSGIKTYSPGTVTIIGGGNCKGQLAEGTASLSSAVDYVFSGESEKTFLDFLKDYFSGDLPSRRIIPGEPLNDLDSLPLVDYELFFKQYARFLGEHTLSKTRIWYETSRGCWRARKSKCALCSEHHTSYGQKSVKKALLDIERISRSYPDKSLFMTDIVMPPSYQEELLPVISEKEGFPSLGYQLRPNMELKDVVNLKKAKITCNVTGIETFSSHLLKLMNKGTTARHSLLYLRNAFCAGILTNWVLLWGFPGDTLADYEEVLDILPLIRHLTPPRWLQPMKLMRFSPILPIPKSITFPMYGHGRRWIWYSRIGPTGKNWRFIIAANFHPNLTRTRRSSGRLTSRWQPGKKHGKKPRWQWDILWMPLPFTTIGISMKKQKPISWIITRQRK
jgi:ribosomal peptide maturation radical SAM protein 1